ncbi:MAG: hypothetical protein HQK79_08845 [Desulfobacterales bacterium]|nr:hypothetical protein [Desulfobacterales bacterium]MBF0396146.1 hypothetical protein [Desulfobacterales bacterium]
MDNLTFGLTLTIVGAGGTLFSLWALTLFIDLLKKLLPYKEEEEEKEEES